MNSNVKVFQNLLDSFCHIHLRGWSSKMPTEKNINIIAIMPSSESKPSVKLYTLLTIGKYMFCTIAGVA